MAEHLRYRVPEGYEDKKPLWTEGVKPRTPESAQPVEKLAKRRSPKVILYLLVLAALLSLGYVGYSRWSNKKDQTLPHNIVAASAFPIYFPQPLPPGYKVDKSAIKQSNGGHLLFYTISDKTEIKTVSISLQSIPQGFNPKEHLVPDVKGLAISAGTLYDDSADGTTKLIILPKDKHSLIFITGQSSDHNLVQKLLDNLKPLTD